VPAAPPIDRAASGAPSPRAERPEAHPDHHRPFGGDRFGILAERFARFFGTPTFIVGQTAIVGLWITLNALAATDAIAWDKYPFIALNLLFSLQAAYAAPLILLAQTRQADRDHARDEALQAHREADAQRVQQFEAGQEQLLLQDKTLAEQHAQMLTQNTQLTEQVAELTRELHAAICHASPPPADAAA
jgi:uncharacterized membrane protein